MAGAGAGPSRGKASHVFLANGHGGECVLTGAVEWNVKRFPLPPGVHVVTIQESGSYTYLDGAGAVRSFGGRGTHWKDIPVRPATGDGKRCRSDYMKFLHEIAQSFDVVDAALTEAENAKSGKGDAKKMAEYSDLLDYVKLNWPKDEFGKRKQDISSIDPEYLDRLCKLYETKLHFHYPGDAVAENTFIPLSYVLDKPVGGKIVAIDGACGLLDQDKLLAIPDLKRRILSRQHGVGDSERPRLSEFYSASVYPTQSDVEKVVASNGGKDSVAMDAISNGALNINLSDLVQKVVTEYEVTTDNPVVLYYAVCRDIEAEEKGDKRMIKTAVSLSRAFSSEQSSEPRQPPSGGPMRREPGRIISALAEQSGLPPLKKKGGKRRTYRKKKLRNQTRKRRQ